VFCYVLLRPTKSEAIGGVGMCRMHRGHFLGGNWIELSLKDRYLRKGYYIGVANRSGFQSDSCARDRMANGTPRIVIIKVSIGL